MKRKTVYFFLTIMLIGGSTFSSFAWSSVKVKNCADKTLNCVFAWGSGEYHTKVVYEESHDIESNQDYKQVVFLRPINYVKCGKEAFKIDEAAGGWGTFLKYVEYTYKNNILHEGLKDCNKL
jgi:hypothetical protein